MAYGDPVYIQPQNEGPAPVAYKLAARQQIEPMTAQATYDGSGAGGDFVPALAFYSNNGRLLARAVVGSTVTAGDTASVSWFPFAQGASATPTPFDLTVTDGTITAHNVDEIIVGPELVLTNFGGGFVKITTNPAGGGFEDFSTSVSTTITAGSTAALPFVHLDGSNLTNLGTPTAPTVVAAGVYALGITVAVTPAITAGLFYRMSITLNHTSGAASIETDVGAIDTASAGAGAQEYGLNLNSPMPAGAVLEVGVTNYDSIDHDFGIIKATLSKNL